MKPVFFTFFTLFILMGCDKSASKLDDNSEVRLKISISKSFSDNYLVESVGKNVYIEIQLFEDKVDSQTGDVKTRHIGVTKSGQFTLDIDSNSYDLSDYYNEGSILYGDGSYRFDLYDLEGDIEQLVISFSFSERNYTAELDVPQTMLVLNNSGVAGYFDSLQDDILLEWGAVTLPAIIGSYKYAQFKGENNCKTNEFELEVLSEESELVIPFEPIDDICDVDSKELTQVTTSVYLEQLPQNLLADYSGYSDVSVVFSQRYYWYHESPL